MYNFRIRPTLGFVPSFGNLTIMMIARRLRSLFDVPVKSKRPTSSSAFIFDEDIKVNGESAFISDRYSIGDAPNGGYLMALAVQKALQTSEKPDPLSATAHFYHKALEKQPAKLQLDMLSSERSMDSCAVGIFQESGGRERLMMHCLVALGDISRLKGPSHRDKDFRPPVLPPIEECIEAGPLINKSFGGHLKIESQYSVRLPQSDPFTTSTLASTTSSIASIEGYCKFRDSRPHCSRFIYSTNYTIILVVY